jgi:hypothetical protein
MCNARYRLAATPKTKKAGEAKGHFKHNRVYMSFVGVYQESVTHLSFSGMSVSYFGLYTRIGIFEVSSERQLQLRSDDI